MSNKENNIYQNHQKIVPGTNVGFTYTTVRRTSTQPNHQHIEIGSKEEENSILTCTTNFDEEQTNLSQDSNCSVYGRKKRKLHIANLIHPDNLTTSRKKLKKASPDKENKYLPSSLELLRNKHEQMYKKNSYITDSTISSKRANFNEQIVGSPSSSACCYNSDYFQFAPVNRSDASSSPDKCSIDFDYNETNNTVNQSNMEQVFNQPNHIRKIPNLQTYNRSNYETTGASSSYNFYLDDRMENSIPILNNSYHNQHSTPSFNNNIYTNASVAGFELKNTSTQYNDRMQQQSLANDYNQYCTEYNQFNFRNLQAVSHNNKFSIPKISHDVYMRGERFKPEYQDDVSFTEGNQFNSFQQTFTDPDTSDQHKDIYELINENIQNVGKPIYSNQVYTKTPSMSINASEEEWQCNQGILQLTTVEGEFTVPRHSDD